MSRIADRITSSSQKNWGMYSKAARLPNQGELIHMELGQPVHALNRMPGMVCPLSEGSIYAFPDIRATRLDSQTPADRLLSEAQVVVESGAFHGAAGEGYLRICFGSQTLPVIKEVVNRLDYFFNDQIKRCASGRTRASL
jgi:aspartate/methionine/tyrosine aminotransferase